MLDDKVRAFLQRKGLKLDNKKLLIGVSGGPDSLALLHFLWSKKEQYNLQIIAAHVDHMFRGEESLAEAKFVQQFCEARKIPFEMERVNVPQHIQKTGKSSQIAARECRYQFFEKVMSNHETDYLVLGHHGDDQVETILMRLTRGSSGEARAGIAFLRPFGKGQILRPFLCLNRMQIEEYCLEHDLDPRRDPSNDKGIYSRNRFRKEIMPFLRKENPQVHEHFQRFSEEIQSDEFFLQELTVQKMNKVMDKKSAQEIILNIRDFQAMPMPLQRRGIQLILNYLYKKKPASLSALHTENVFSLISNPHPSGTLHFPSGLNIVRSYEKCYFLFRSHSVQSYRFEIAGPGEVKLPTGSSIVFEYTQGSGEGFKPHTLLLDCNAISLPIVIRTRENGDRMKLKGMQGSKKVKDIFIDKKVPLQERNTWPIVTDSKGEILWIPGLKESQYSTGCHSDSRYILLSYMEK
ncbi:tRNA lysidine(34) synthetase TilS [Bacillus sp. DTU_2020_1000418_1_SI_GHA_SEK_038]|uniref:tRNA lysidine(34) synthetase TilS n=1 Tax=Bacillus sp. DTU_2020_1000418_1_SI_GHA_SEK_038 TaxID=3077585 RepID=UPI0028E6CD87|nr:tRNA lysidine(34) synthetase TilS [Bacillus sp. DTU_2020_1000418_1_SI_GHA_SEK_038]WNS75563.1 tRNA lysidine(34) synthetase TilS [Bacillus sp. DTU_2020_1000418_1_SI_GHA_SEK_038]